ncbi:MAG: TrkA family potassium uptake protein [Dehalococcoidia bacterium]
MYIIVSGGGNVGYGIALELQRLPDYEVTIVELSSSRASALRDEIGEMVVHGDGSEIAFLESVGASRADLVIALTADDGANLVTAQVARHWFKVPRVIARVNDPRNEPLFRKLGVDSIVSAAGAVMAQIEATLPEHTLIPLMALESAGLQIVTMRVQEGAEVSGRNLRDLRFPAGVLITIVIGPDGAETPSGDTVLRPGHEIIAVVPRDAEDALRAMVTAPLREDGD